MKKKILCMCIVLSLTAALAAGCGKTEQPPTDANASASPAAQQQAEESGKKSTKKVNVKDLSETSKPIGVSELSAIKKENGDLYLTGKVINNGSEFGETVVTIEFDILDNSGKKIISHSSTTDQIADGDTFVLDEDILYLGNAKDIVEPLTVKIVNMQEIDAGFVKLADEFADDLTEVGNMLDQGKYNTAATAWEDLKEKYGEDFKDQIKKAEASMRDSGIDPDNIAAGMSNEAQEAAELEETISQIKSAKWSKEYNKAQVLLDEALKKYPDNTELKLLQAEISDELAKKENQSSSNPQ